MENAHSYWDCLGTCPSTGFYPIMNPMGSLPRSRGRIVRSYGEFLSSRYTFSWHFQRESFPCHPVTLSNKVAWKVLNQNISAPASPLPAHFKMRTGETLSALLIMERELESPRELGAWFFRSSRAPGLSFPFFSSWLCVPWRIQGEGRHLLTLSH